MTSDPIILGLGIGLIVALIWRLLIPMGWNLLESWRAMREAERMHREHMEFQRRKANER